MFIVHMADIIRNLADKSIDSQHLKIMDGTSTLPLFMEFWHETSTSDHANSRRVRLETRVENVVKGAVSFFSPLVAHVEKN